MVGHRHDQTCSFPGFILIFSHLLWSGFRVGVLGRRVGFLGLRPVLRGLLGFFCAQTIWAHRGINLGVNMVHESFIIYFVVDGE